MRDIKPNAIAAGTDIAHIYDMANELPFRVKKLVNLTEDQASQISEFRFAERLKSENEAIRTLIQRGLEGQALSKKTQVKAAP